MIDILNLALPYFGLIFIGYVCGKAKGLPEGGTAAEFGEFVTRDIARWARIVKETGVKIEQ